jgi:beta-glucosidase
MSDHIDRLLARMTLEQKLGQLNMVDGSLPHNGHAALEDDIRAGRVGSVLNVYGAPTRALQRIAVAESALGIPLFFGLDVLHGHHTIFPVPLAEAGAFDPNLWRLTARAAAEEATGDGIDLTFAPMLDVSREPRWGRIVESPGEDSLVASRYAVAKVQGFQGDDLSRPDAIAATAKHFVAYGAVIAGREYASVDISERQLRETHLPPFEAAVRAGVAAIMPAFNDVAGVPMSAHRALMRKLVRETWGFGGVMLSDYNAVAELAAHGLARDAGEAAALALDAGMDIDMHALAYPRALPAAIEQGRATVAQIDAAVRRVLRLKQALGLFDEPFRRSGAAPLASARRAEITALARDAARRSIVLLRNDPAILPLARDLRRVALIGPLADAPLEMLGPWFAAAGIDGHISIREGLEAALGRGRIGFAEGVPMTADDASGIPDALALARQADVIVLALGEPKTLTGEGNSRGHIGLPGRQRDLAEALFALGKPTVTILTHGRPLALPWLFAKPGAVLATWFLGSQAGHAIADVLIGATNPGGKLAITWPVDVAQIPIHFAERATGRPGRPDEHFTSRWIDLPLEPQFPFGHGLSYTTFEISELRATPFAPRIGDAIEVEATVRNTGGTAGEETVFLFIRDPVATIARPKLELKDFVKVMLAPGEAQPVRFAFTTDDLGYLDADLTPRIDPGDIDILIGPSADAKRLMRTTIKLVAPLA